MQKTKNLAKVKKGTKKVNSAKNHKKFKKIQEEIKVDFEFHDMKDQPSDYHAVKQFLNVIFGISSSVNTTGLADLITSSELVKSIGSIVKTEDEDSAPCGFTSLLTLKSLPDKSLSKFLEDLNIPTKETAILFNERFINLPSPIAVQLYNLLLDDYSEAQSLFPKFQNVIIPVPVVKYIDEQAEKKSDEFEHEYPETEFLEEFSIFRANYKVPSSHETSDSRRLFSEQGVEKWRIFFVIPSKNLFPVNFLFNFQI
jgi:hypothetical protein